MTEDTEDTKLRVTITFDVPVRDLTHYDAKTLAEAAANARRWYADGSASAVDDLCAARHVTIIVDPLEAGADASPVDTPSVDADEETRWRALLSREVYAHADRLEREPETRSLGVALASIVRHVGDQIGRTPKHGGIGAEA